MQNNAYIGTEAGAGLNTIPRTCFYFVLVSILRLRTRATLRPPKVKRRRPRSKSTTGVNDQSRRAASANVVKHQNKRRTTHDKTGNRNGVKALFFGLRSELREMRIRRQRLLPRAYAGRTAVYRLVKEREQKRQNKAPPPRESSRKRELETRCSAPIGSSEFPKTGTNTPRAGKPAIKKQE